MKLKICTISSIAALLIGSGIVNAQTVALPGTIEIPEGSDAYVNSGGNAIRTGLGDCLKLNGFDEESQVNACEGIEDVVAEVAVEPEPEPAPAPEPVPKEPIVTTATLSGEALFDSNSADLNSASEEVLAELVSDLSSYQEISEIKVTGHTDSTGPEEYNQALSERRATSVQAYLQAAYPSANVIAEGLGETSPVSTNTSPVGRQANRRVDIQVTARSITE